jgi:hypothetical protein
MVYDLTGNMHLCYVNEYNNNITYHNGESEIADAVVDSGNYVSIALDPSGTPYISYSDTMAAMVT